MLTSGQSNLAMAALTPWGEIGTPCNAMFLGPHLWVFWMSEGICILNSTQIILSMQGVETESRQCRPSHLDKSLFNSERIRRFADFWRISNFTVFYRPIVFVVYFTVTLTNVSWKRSSPTVEDDESESYSGVLWDALQYEVRLKSLVWWSLVHLSRLKWSGM